MLSLDSPSLDLQIDLAQNRLLRLSGWDWSGETRLGIQGQADWNRAVAILIEYAVSPAASERREGVQDEVVDTSIGRYETRYFSASVMPEASKDSELQEILTFWQPLSEASAGFAALILGGPTRSGNFDSSV